MSAVTQVEPLLHQKGYDRFCLFPLKYPAMFDRYQKHIACFWTVAEVDLAPDQLDIAKLTPGEKTFIMTVLAFFHSADLIVNENLAHNFSVEIQATEARMFYDYQAGMETIHAHMYGLMIQSFEPDAQARESLFFAVNTNPTIKKKADWATKWFDRKVNVFAKRLVAFACVEGIFFSASFCAIYYFKKRGLMPGLAFSNELISRDEGMHTEFACHVYSQLQPFSKLNQETIVEIIDEAVNLENEFVRDALHVDLIGMNAELMQQYVKFVADHLLEDMGHKKHYHVRNPFEWMELISLEGKTNFFEKRVGEYQKAGMMEQRAERQFTQDDDF